MTFKKWILSLVLVTGWIILPMMPASADEFTEFVRVFATRHDDGTPPLYTKPEHVHHNDGTGSWVTENLFNYLNTSTTGQTEAMYYGIDDATYEIVWQNPDGSLVALSYDLDGIITAIMWEDIYGKGPAVINDDGASGVLDGPLNTNSTGGGSAEGGAEGGSLGRINFDNGWYIEDTNDNGYVDEGDTVYDEEGNVVEGPDDDPSQDDDNEDQLDDGNDEDVTYPDDSGDDEDEDEEEEDGDGLVCSDCRGGGPSDTGRGSDGDGDEDGDEDDDLNADDRVTDTEEMITNFMNEIMGQEYTDIEDVISIEVLIQVPAGRRLLDPFTSSSPHFSSKLPSSNLD